MNRPVHALVLGLSLSLLASSSFASSLEMKGNPEPNVAAMPAYGMDVATRMGLKTVIPTGWQLFVHRSVALPDTMNWNRGEAWPAVLTKFASDNQMAVLIDWDNHVVMLRSPEQALEEGAKREEIAQAATTPLPKFEAGAKPVKSAAVPVVASRAGSQASGADTGATALPTFNIATAAESTQLAATRPVNSAAKPAASVVAPVAPVLVAKATPVPETKTTQAVTQPATVLAAKPVQATPTATALTSPLPTTADKSAQLALAQKSADASAKLAATQKARIDEDARLASLQKTRSMEDAKLVEAQTARVSESQKLVGIQKANEVENAKLNQTQKARDAEVAKLVSVQKATEAEALKLADLKKANDTEAAKLASAKVAAQVSTQVAAKTIVTPMPVIRVNPTPVMVSVQAEAAKKAPEAKLASTDDFSYSTAAAFNRPTARNMAQAIASHFDLRLVYAGEEYVLRGPVTLMAESATQDAALLERAIGLYGPVVLEVDNAQKILRVMPRNASAQQLAEIRARRPAAPIRVAVLPVTSSPVIAASAAGAVPVPTKAVTLPAIRIAPLAPTETAVITAKSGVIAETAKPGINTPLTLDVIAHQPLEDALSRFTRSQGYTIEWKVSGGFEANRAMSFTGHTVRDVLSQVLPKLGLSADIYTREKHIVVRPGDAAQDR